MRNNHDLSTEELQEVFNDAAQQFILTNDATVYALRLLALGISSAEIASALQELEIKKAEAFNARLAAIQARYQKGRAA